MTIEIIRTALVRGCFNRQAIINIRGDEGEYYYGRDFYMRSPAPQTLEQAGHINQQLVLLMQKVNNS